MTQQRVEEVPTPEPAKTPEAKPDYDLHIKVPAEMRQVLKDSAELAFKLGDVAKPKLGELMNLFIGWGLQIQKGKWLDRTRYRYSLTALVL